MAKITPENIANLKALFQDNEKALGSNFSQLIDFFNNNKVTDNGDGTFTVGTIMVDASKLYDLINNSSPNILPLDNEFTGKNTFDIAPINKANGKPYITEDSVPQVDLSNYPTKDQLATKADTSAIDPSVLLGAIPITSTTDLFTLDPGTYFGNNVTPINGPAISSLPTTNYFWVKLETPKANALIKKLTWTDNGNHQYVNEYYGIPANWHAWQILNSATMASKTDVTTAISAATANMADTTKATNFTNGLQSGGVDVATAADLKSVEDQAWREVTNSNFQGSYLFRDNQDGTATLSGTIYFTAPTQTYNGYPDFIIPLPAGYSAKGDVYDWDQTYTFMYIRDTQSDESIVKTYYPGSAMHIYTYGSASVKDAIISLRSPIIQIFNSSSYTASQKVGSIDGFTIKITKA